VRSRVEKADAELRKLEKESESEIQAHGQVRVYLISLFLSCAGNFLFLR
jgi:hypothetical protein